MYSTNIAAMFGLLSHSRRAAANLSICKGIVTATPTRGSDYIVRLDVPGNPVTVTARLHPEAVTSEGFQLPINSPVFVYQDSAEIVAYGQMDKTDNKIKFVKIACIHPIKAKSGKLCTNCPLESKS